MRAREKERGIELAVSVSLSLSLCPSFSPSLSILLAPHVTYFPPQEKQAGEMQRERERERKIKRTWYEKQLNKREAWGEGGTRREEE